MIVFDLDGTLGVSKSPIDAEMADLLKKLLRCKYVCVISGGGWPQYEKQLLGYLPNDRYLLSRLHLMPTCGTKYYEYVDPEWRKVYSHDLTEEEKLKIVNALETAVKESGIVIEKQWGPLIEDRGSQITFSALGQEAPAAEKHGWDKDFSKRKLLRDIAEKYIPEFSVRVGGSTSLDITKVGIDKAFGVRELSKITGFRLNEMLFIGDAIFPGGNDYSVFEAGVDCIKVNTVDETKRVIETLIANKAVEHDFMEMTTAIEEFINQQNPKSEELLRIRKIMDRWV